MSTTPSESMTPRQASPGSNTATSSHRPTAQKRFSTSEQDSAALTSPSQSEPPSKDSLYSIGLRYRDATEALDLCLTDDEEELKQALTEYVEETKGQIHARLEKVGRAHSYYDDLVDSVDKEIERLKEIKTMATKKKDSIMNSIVSAVSRIFPDKKALSFGFFMLKSRASKSVAIPAIDDGLLPDKQALNQPSADEVEQAIQAYLDEGIPRDCIAVTTKTTVTVKPDKTAIKKRLTDGHTVKGCQLQHNTNWSLK